MGPLNFNLLGYSFETGVKILKSAHDAADRALAENVEQAAAAIGAYAEAVTAGKPRIGEWDEEGVRIWEQDQILTHELENARQAQQDLRKAFAISAYHHWERSARRWTKAGRGDNHRELVEKTLAMGWPIDPRLKQVCDLANLLKHETPRTQAALRTSWPALIPPPRRHFDEHDWYERLHLDVALMATLYEIIAGSGPDSHTPFPSQASAGGHETPADRSPQT